MTIRKRGRSVGSTPRKPSRFTVEMLTPHCAYIEFLPAELCESALRRELTCDELRLVDGQVVLSDKPGLGIELNRDALERFRARDG